VLLRRRLAHELVGRSLDTACGGRIIVYANDYLTSLMTRLTIKDVAHAANVSVATVSHVLNETRYVSPELSERVRAVIRDLRYVRDGSARGLRSRRTQVIGLIVPDNTNAFYSQLAQTIEDEGFAAGYTTILCNSGDQPKRERRYLEAMIEKRVDGLILVSTRHDATGLSSLLAQLDCPVVVVDRDISLPDVDLVLADNIGGARAATKHLVDQRHRDVAFISGPSELPSSLERLRGWREQLADEGIEARSDFVFAGDFHIESGRRAVAAFLRAHPAPTAIFAANDLMAFGALTEIIARGLRIPDDIALVGFDDTLSAQLTSPPLSSVRQPVREMARLAVSFLLARIRKEQLGSAQRVVVPTELVVRGSSLAIKHHKEGG